MSVENLKATIQEYADIKKVIVLGEDNVKYTLVRVEKEKNSGNLKLHIRKIVNEMDPMRDSIRAVIKSLAVSSDLGLIDKPVIAAALSDYFILHPSTRPIDRTDILNILISGLHGEQLAEEIFNRAYRTD